MPVSVQQIMETLSPAALTVRAQTVSPIDNGALHWETFFPVDPNILTTRIADIATVDFRPVASRRPWDANGRQIPQRFGKIREGVMTPIEAWFAIGEQEIQKLGEGAFGNALVVLDALKMTVPGRVDLIAMADWRRLELDAIQAWVSGKINVTDPDDQTKSFDMSYNADAARYPAAPATYAAAPNAYQQFIDTFYRPALDATGGLEGALMRRAIIDQIVLDSPVAVGIPGYRPTIKDVESRISDEYGYTFRFMMAEWSMDIPDAFGTYTRQKYFPADVIAAIPTGNVVGKTAKPPQYHAWDVMTETALQKIGFDKGGVMVVPTVENSGKSLKCNGKLLAMPFPDEGKVFVQRGAQ